MAELSKVKWDELLLPAPLLKGIYGHGFEDPSPIQAQACPFMIEGRHVIAQAQSGTGKTGAFSVGVLARIDTSNSKVQAIIISHVHELALQTARVVESLGTAMDGLRVQTLVGKTLVSADKAKLRSNPPQVVVGTPGRILALIDQEAVNTRDVRVVVIDEADELLSCGFSEQIYQILGRLPSDVQIALFSATLPPNILEMGHRFMPNAATITVAPPELTLNGIKQYYVRVASDTDKYDIFERIFNNITMSQCIVFCNSIHRVVALFSQLQADGYPVCQIHSEMDPVERRKVFQEFVSGRYRLMLSTDLTSRGIDIQQVECVVNFDLTKNVQNYLHRIGRSGRWGRKGVAINFITPSDVRTMDEIVSHYHCNVDQLPSNFSG